MAEIKEDARYDAFFQRVLVDRDAARPKMPGRIDMRAAMVGHRDEHRGKPVDIAGVGKGILVVLPDAMDDGRMAGIGRSAMMEFAAEVDDFHEILAFEREGRGGP